MKKVTVDGVEYVPKKTKREVYTDRELINKSIYKNRHVETSEERYERTRVW